MRDESVQINLFLGDVPYALGHIVIEPKSEAHDISDLSIEQWGVFTEWIVKVTKAMKKVLREIVGKEVEKIYVCSFNEDPNCTVHFHVVPRYKGDETIRGPKLLAYRMDAKQVISPAEKQKIVDSLRKELEKE